MAAHRPRIRVGLLLGSYVVALVAYVWLRTESLLPGILAVLVIGFFGLRLHDAVCAVIGDEPPSAGAWRLIAGVGAVGAGLVVAAQIGGWSGVGFFGVALAYLAAGAAVAAWRSGSLPAKRLAAGFGVCVVLAGGSLVLLALGAGGGWLWWPVGLGLLATPLVLSLASENGLRYLGVRPRTSSALVALVGAAGLVLTLLLVATVGPNVYVFAFGVVLVVLMLGIVARTNADIVLVVALVAVVWALTQRTVAEPEALADPEPGVPVMAALGDSFISGEGAEEYFAGTNTPGENTCRRAPTAYPVLLTLERHEELPEHLVFRACSGATIDEVGPIDGSDGDTQLDELTAVVGVDDVELIAAMIGGNDALFGTIGRACLLPIDCTPLESAWRANLELVGESLDALYAKIRDTFPDARLVVVPYPVPITEDRVNCSYSAFSREEHRLLHNFALALNTTVVDAAQRADFEVVDTMPTAFEDTGLRLCDGEAGDVGVNFFAANSVTGTIEQSVDPRNWIHNSLHPNARGHEAMRSAFMRWIEHESPPATPEAPDDPHSDSDACRGKFGTELDQCAKDWVAQQAAQAILVKGWLVLPAVTGAWLLALGLAGVVRSLVAD